MGLGKIGDGGCLSFLCYLVWPFFPFCSCLLYRGCLFFLCCLLSLCLCSFFCSTFYELLSVFLQLLMSSFFSFLSFFCCRSFLSSSSWAVSFHFLQIAAFIRASLFRTTMAILVGRLYCRGRCTNFLLAHVAASRRIPQVFPRWADHVTWRLKLLIH